MPLEGICSSTNWYKSLGSPAFSDLTICLCLCLLSSLRVSEWCDDPGDPSKVLEVERFCNTHNSPKPKWPWHLLWSHCLTNLGPWGLGSQSKMCPFRFSRAGLEASFRVRSHLNISLEFFAGMNKFSHMTNHWENCERPKIWEATNRSTLRLPCDILWHPWWFDCSRTPNQFHVAFPGAFAFKWRWQCWGNNWSSKLGYKFIWKIETTQFLIFVIYRPPEIKKKTFDATNQDASLESYPASDQWGLFVGKLRLGLSLLKHSSLSRVVSIDTLPG